MYSTTIFLLACDLLVTMVMARPWSGHHHGDSDNEMSEESHGHKWATYHLPKDIRIPHLLAQKLGRPWPTFTTKKIFDGKYLLISPALMFRLKDMDNDTDITTTNIPASSTPRPTRSATGSGEEVEETTTIIPGSFKKRFFQNDDDDDNEQLFFLGNK
ncbi:hypothetical protein I4U23_008694 [Adineta vaga]|nr:hypothetical protein I4U23_008694 [Adineta vaga]